MEGNSSSNVSDFSEDSWSSSHKPGGATAIVASKIIVGAIGVVGNLLVVIVFMKYKKLFQNIKTTFIVNQSVIDGIVSLLLITTTFTSREIHDDVDGKWIGLYCKLWLSQVLVWGLMTASTYNLMAISTERYVAIVHPMWHKVSFTKSMAIVIAVFIWIFGVAFEASIVIPTTAILRGVCFNGIVWPSRATARAVAFVQIFVNVVMPIFVHSFCYTRILFELRKRTTTVTPEERSTTNTQSQKTRRTNAIPTTKGGVSYNVSLPSSSNTNVPTIPKSSASIGQPSRSSDKQHNPLETQNEKAKRNVAKTLAIVTACYFICWMPNKICLIMFLTGAMSTFPTLCSLTIIPIIINCCINPIIYIGKYDAFKTGLSLLLRALIGRTW